MEPAGVKGERDKIRKVSGKNKEEVSYEVLKLKFTINYVILREDFTCREGHYIYLREGGRSDQFTATCHGGWWEVESMNLQIVTRQCLTLTCSARHTLSRVSVSECQGSAQLSFPHSPKITLIVSAVPVQSGEIVSRLRLRLSQSFVCIVLY